MNGWKWSKLRRAATALALCGMAWACGKTEQQDADGGATAGSSSGGSSAAGQGTASGGSGHASGGRDSGGASAGGSRGGASSGAGRGGVSAGGGGASAAGGGGRAAVPPGEFFPLLVGDGECPEFAPDEPSCDVEASCVYPGIRIPHPREGEARCDCVDEQWLCVNTEKRLEVDCPLVHPDRLKVEAAPCPPEPDRVCFYYIAGNPFGVACGCNFLGSGDPTDWMCDGSL